MTDKFEEFLINEVEKYNNSHENVPDDWSNPVDVLSKYREFLKEQTPKEPPLVFWGGIYHKWDETKKRFIPQFAARLK